MKTIYSNHILRTTLLLFYILISKGNLYASEPLPIQICTSSQSNILSTISSTTVARENAQEVFSFTIKNLSKTDTYIRNISFQTTVNNSNIPCNKIIAGAVLLKENKVVARSNEISKSKILFKDKILIKKMAENKLSLGIFLHQNNLPDNAIIQFSIPHSTFSWKTSDNERLTAPLQTIYSQKIKLETIANRLHFSNCPSTLTHQNSNYSFRLLARDDFGNIDTDYNALITIQAGKMSRSDSMRNGIVKFEKLKNYSQQDFCITARSSTKLIAHKKVIVSKLQTLASENFENNTFSQWQNISNWEISSDSPIEGKYTLKHLSSSKGATFYTSYNIGEHDFTNGTTQWQWQIRNGQWSPSSQNAFHWILCATTPDLQQNTRFAVGVNHKSRNDTLTLWKITDTKTKTLLKAPFRWGKDWTLGIKVTRSPNGKWTLEYDNNGDFDNLYSSTYTTDSTPIVGNLYCGIVFKCNTPSHSGKLWLDDIQITHFKQIPKVQNIKANSNTQLLIEFNQAMDSIPLISQRNYFIENTEIKDIKQLSNNKIQLTTEPFVEGIHKLYLHNLRNSLCRNMVDTVLSFVYSPTAKQSDIVINEVLFNPPILGDNYIEIYNNSSTTFDLSSLYISSKSTNGKIKYSIPISTRYKAFPPHTFCVITPSPNFVKQRYIVKNPLVVQKVLFPHLSKNSGNILLINENSEIIDAFNYNKSMHSEFLNSTNGIALERIDYNAPTNNRDNWQSASTLSGYGTPSYENSKSQKTPQPNYGWHISQKSFSPNSDGQNDYLRIHYKLPTTDYIANIRIFSASGRIVKELIRNNLLDIEGIILWDGSSDNNQQLPTGRYIILIETISANGDISQVKKTCVLYSNPNL